MPGINGVYTEDCASIEFVRPFAMPISGVTQILSYTHTIQWNLLKIIL